MPGYETIAPQSAALICPECDLLLRDAVQTDDGIRLCKSCFKQILQQTRECRIQQPCMPVHIDRAARMEVAKIEVRCDYCKTWSDKEENLQAHLRNECPNFLHPCPNEGCEEVLSAARMNDHLKYCQYRRVTCDWCHDEMAINLLGGKHMIKRQLYSRPFTLRESAALNPDTDCPLEVKPRPLKAIYNCITLLYDHPHHMSYCGEYAARDAGVQDVLHSHIAEYGPPLYAEFNIEEHPPLQHPIQEEGIPNVGVELPYPTQEQGIQNLGEELPYPIQEQDGQPAPQAAGPRPLHPQNIDRLRQRLDGLPEDPRRHSELLLQLIYDLTVEISSLRHHIAQLTLQLQVTPHNGTLLWRIQDVARKRRDAVQQRGKPLYSPPFYTGRYGYKMCIRAYLNGDGSGTKTHLSLFFVLMKGEYDAHLKWPFNHKVSMILVNQNQRAHLVQTFKPTPESSSFQRPQTDINVASGCPQFAKLSVLDDEDYVKENVMYIKCIVDTSRIFHP